MMFTVTTAGGEKVTVEADHASEEQGRNKVVFFNDDGMPVASFTGAQEWYPAAE